jgi:hypothetical protein
MAITTNGGAGVTADAVATLSNKTLEAPVINNATFTGAQAGLEIKFGNNIVLEGTTDNAFETTVTAGDPTADRTITLPDVTGTVVTTGNLTAITTVTSATLTSPTITGAVFNDGSVVFEGATANDFETTLTITDPTADRTITFPDSTGTVALTSGVINNSLLTTTGDTIYASGASTPARLAIGSAGQTLTVSAGGIPEWATPAAGTTANDQAFAFAVQVFA